MRPVGFFDTHAHYDDDRFAAEFAIDTNGRRYAGTDGAISYVHDCGADYICNVGASLPSSHASLALADRYPFVYAAVGLHPSDAQRIPLGMEEDALSDIREMARHKKAVAIGEIGLDYHYDDTDRARQHWFSRRKSVCPLSSTTGTRMGIRSSCCPGTVHAGSFTAAAAARKWHGNMSRWASTSPFPVH